MTKIRKRIHEIIEIARYDDPQSRLFDLLLIFLIVGNVAAVIAHSLGIESSVVVSGLEIFRGISLAFFAVEYFLRLWTCVEHRSGRFRMPVAGRLRFAGSPLMLLDLAAILPFNLMFAGAPDLRVLRIFRLFSLIRLTNYSQPLEIMVVVLRREWKTLFAFFFILISLLLVAGTLMHFIEREAQPETFGSIPHAIWWGMATLTTVGYGDVVPVTVPGKLFGAVIMFIGIGMFALPTGILVSAFSQELKRKDFIAIWNLVAKVPWFSHLNAVEIAAIVDMLHLFTAMPGQVIFKQGEEGDSMYFIVSGEVEITIGKQSRLEQDGDFFGEIALLYHEKRSATVVAKTFVELLRLDARDIDTLLESNQEIKDQITLEARKRHDRRQDGTLGN
ncbi:MAG: cyclic nucleotide-gated ion channel [Gammaproteobacteria bacterium]